MQCKLINQVLFLTIVVAAKGLAVAAAVDIMMTGREAGIKNEVLVTETVAEKGGDE